MGEFLQNELQLGALVKTRLASFWIGLDDVFKS